jgi:putative zinc finger protein
MTNDVLCDEFAERLADLLERDVDEGTRAALEAHALSCTDCGSVLADLRKLRIDASNLPLLSPGRDLWQAIAERIDAPVILLHSAAGGRASRPRSWGRVTALSAAAVVLVAATSVTTYYLTLSTRASRGPRVVASTPTALDSVPSGAVPESRDLAAVRTSPDSTSTPRAGVVPKAVRQQPAPMGTPARLVANRPSAEQVYVSEIARLHTIVQQRRAQLDPVTVSVIERNLKVIDDAIAQCKLALAKDPASRFLMESLNNALETKVELLRTAALLPSRS